MTRPDFGWHEIEHDGVKLTCRYVAPDLTMQDLVKIFVDAEAGFKPGDRFSGNPAKWPNARGIAAVTDAILNAVYK
jgi:hypothetical protein